MHRTSFLVQISLWSLCCRNEWKPTGRGTAKYFYTISKALCTGSSMPRLCLSVAIKMHKTVTLLEKSPPNILLVRGMNFVMTHLRPAGDSIFPAFTTPSIQPSPNHSRRPNKIQIITFRNSLVSTMALLAVLLSTNCRASCHQMCD